MDTRLKQRLIGAAVLIALAVIFLPMLVQGPAPDSGVSDVPLDVPGEPGVAMETRDLPLVSPQAGGGSVMPLQAGGRPESSLPTVDTRVDAGDGTPMPAATAGGAYAVHFGTYGSQNDAEVIVRQLTQAQLPGHSEATTLNGQPAWRVRIGPYGSRAEAEAVRLRSVQVRDDVGARVVVLDAAADGATPAAATAAAETPSTPATPPAAATVAVVEAPATQPAQPTPQPARPDPKPQPAPPAAKPEPAKPVAEVPAPKPTPASASAPAPAPAPAKPAAAATGFAVQLGAFGNAEEATRLRDRARAAGLSAFVEQVQTDKGPLTRVRLGPVLDRDAATALQQQAQAKLGVSGVVRPHP